MSNLDVSRTVVAHTPENEAYFSDFATWLSLSGRNGRGRSARSVSAYLQDLRLFCTWFEDHTGQGFAPEMITSQDLRAYYQHSADHERVAPATWNRRRISLALFCDWAHSHGKAAYNPFQGVPVMAEVSQFPHWLDKNDNARFMRRVEQETNTAKTVLQRKNALRDQAMISLMAYAGLRVGEVAELTPHDLLLSDRKGAVEVRNGKGGKTRRVPLGREARRALAAWMEVQDFVDDASLFGVSARQIQRVVRSIGRQAGVAVTPHRLRHTMLKRFIDSGGQLTEAAKIAGHARLETTRVYVCPGWADLEEAVENL